MICKAPTDLRGYSVTPGREQLGDTGGVKTRLCEAKGGSETSTTSTTFKRKVSFGRRVHSRHLHDYRIVLVLDEWIFARGPGLAAER